MAGSFGEPALADPDPYDLRARVTAGYRLVDIDGAKDKYKEDFDLRSGGRLFDLAVDGRARKPEDTLIDRFHLEVDRPHDEPLSRARLRVADEQRYDFRASFKKATYFYDVPQLFSRPVADVRRLDDLHDYDLERTHGTMDLTVRPTDTTRLLAGYRLYRREGDTVTTRFVPGSDAFLLRRDIDAFTHVGFLGAQTTFLGTNVALRQEFRRSDRTFETDGPVPGGRGGLDPTDGGTLDLFVGDQDERADAPVTTVRVRRPIGDRAEVTGAYVYTHVDLDVDRDLTRVATVDQPGFPTNDARSTDGKAELDAHVVDLGAEVVVTDRVRVHAGYRFDERAQDADLKRVDVFGRLVAATSYHLQRHHIEGDVRVQVLPELSLRAGARYGRRDAHFSTGPESVSSDTVGLLADARYRPWSFLDLFARYENLQLDDPVSTLGARRNGVDVPDREIAFTFVNRGSAGFRLEPASWATVGYRFVADSRENDSFGGRMRAIGNHVTLDLVPLPDLTLFLSYSRRDVEDDGDIRTAPLYQAATALQRSSEDVLLAQLSYAFALLGQRWSSGGTLSFAISDQVLRPAFEPGKVRAAFDLDRIDGGLFLRLHHAWFEPSIELRRIEYDERALPANDYDATIVAFKVTRRWSK